MLPMAPTSVTGIPPSSKPKIGFSIDSIVGKHAKNYSDFNNLKDTMRRNRSTSTSPDRLSSPTLSGDSNNQNLELRNTNLRGKFPIATENDENNYQSEFSSFRKSFQMQEMLPSEYNQKNYHNEQDRFLSKDGNLSLRSESHDERFPISYLKSTEKRIESPIITVEPSDVSPDNSQRSISPQRTPSPNCTASQHHQHLISNVNHQLRKLVNKPPANDSDEEIQREQYHQHELFFKRNPSSSSPAMARQSTHSPTSRSSSAVRIPLPLPGIHSGLVRPFPIQPTAVKNVTNSKSSQFSHAFTTANIPADLTISLESGSTPGTSSNPHPFLAAHLQMAAALANGQVTSGFPAVGMPPQHHPHFTNPNLIRDSYPLYPWLLSRHGRIFPHRFPGNFLLQPFRKPKRVRTAFSPSQLLKLEHAFEGNHYVVGSERKTLAQTLSLTETQVKVWFQNRRTKHKRMQQEEDAKSGSDGTRNSNGLTSSNNGERNLTSDQNSNSESYGDEEEAENGDDDCENADEDDELIDMDDYSSGHDTNFRHQQEQYHQQFQQHQQQLQQHYHNQLQQHQQNFYFNHHQQQSHSNSAATSSERQFT